MKRRGQEKHAESLIPLLLIVVLGVFIAGKFGFVDLHSLPGIGTIFPASYIRTVVIGHPSPEMEQLLQSEDFRLAGITYAHYLSQEMVLPGTLKNYEIIILQGDTGTGGYGAVCDRTARKVIADKINSGGKLIVIGDACTRVSDDANALGWDIGIGTLGGVVPVRYGGVVAHEKTGQQAVFADGKFKVIAQDHPAFNGITNFGFYGWLTNVYPNENSNVLAYVDTYLGKPTSPATFAIVESQGFLSGKTIYFAFDPATYQQTGGSRNLFLNTLLYLKGAKG